MRFSVCILLSYLKRFAANNLNNWKYLQTKTSYTTVAQRKILAEINIVSCLLP